MGKFLREALEGAVAAKCAGPARQWNLLVADDDVVQLGGPFSILAWFIAWYSVATQGQLHRA